MSYKASCRGCPRLPVWSSPKLFVKGEPAGTPLQDNARVIAEQAARVANFRSSRNGRIYIGSPVPSVSSTGTADEASRSSEIPHQRDACVVQRQCRCGERNRELRISATHKWPVFATCHVSDSAVAAAISAGRQLRQEWVIFRRSDKDLATVNCNSVL